MKSSKCLAFALVCAWGLWVGVASAQQQADEEAAARTAFEKAQQAVQQDRLEEAQELFRQSIERFPTAAAAYNLAVVLDRQQQMQGALEVVAEALDGAYGELSKQSKAQFQAFERTLHAEMPTVHIDVQGAPRAKLFVDGQRVGEVDAQSQVTRKVNPGSHVIRAEADDGRSAQREIALERSEEEYVTLELEPRVTSPVQPDVLRQVTLPTDEGVDAPGLKSQAPPELDAGSSSPWPWIAVAGGVGVLAAVAAAVLLSTASSAEPYRDPVWGPVEVP